MDNNIIIKGIRKLSSRLMFFDPVVNVITTFQYGYSVILKYCDNTFN